MRKPLILLILLLGCNEVTISNEYVDLGIKEDLFTDDLKKESIIYTSNDFETLYCSGKDWRYLNLDIVDNCAGLITDRCVAYLEIKKDWKKIKVNIDHEWNLRNFIYGDKYTTSTISFGVYDDLIGIGNSLYLIGYSGRTTTSNIFDMTDFKKPILSLRVDLDCNNEGYVWKWRIYNISIEKIE